MQSNLVLTQKGFRLPKLAIIGSLLGSVGLPGVHWALIGFPLTVIYSSQGIALVRHS